MLRKYMVLYAPDANTGGDSSTSPDDKGQDSSTEQQAVEKAVADVQSTSSDKETEEAAPEVEVEEETTEKENEEPTEEQTEEVVEEKPVALDKPEDEKLPFHKEPRFQELVAEKNTYKQEIETLKPQAARAKILDDYVAQHNIQPQQLQSALEYLRLLNSEPAKAYEMLKPTYERLAQLTGERLPEDLQSRVAAGTLEPELAKEIAQSREQKNYSQWQQQTKGMSATQQTEAAVQGAINTWAQATMARDPDLKQGGEKYEYLDMKLRTLRQANPPATPADGLKLVEQAYADTNKFFGKFNARKIVKKPIQSQQSSQNASAVVKTVKDVVAALLSGKKPHQLKYS